MVSVSIFIIVAFISSTVFITVNEANKRAQAIRLIVDNLNFTLDGITYRLAEGVNYESSTGDPERPQISFDYLPPGSGAEEKIIYELDYRANGDKSIFLTGDGFDHTDLLSPEISLGENSSFEILNPTGVRPYVLISLQGKAKVGRSETKLNLQTAVTGRNF